jgi:hypothetical protein
MKNYEYAQTKTVHRNRTLIAITIIIIVVIALGAYVYQSNQIYQVKRNSDLLDYKKGLYETVFCQYKCPLKTQLYQNTTQLIPDLECVKNCSASFKTKYNSAVLNKLNFTKQELSSDNFFNDIELIIANCKTQSADSASLLNNTQFFSCSVKGLELIREKYNYLKV